MRSLFVKRFTEKQLRAIGRGRIASPDELRLWMEQIITINIEAAKDAMKKPTKISIRVKR